MSDLELLEKAARAAGIEVHRGHGWQSDRLFRPSVGDGTITGVEWNPLTDDGDALRLAVTLGIELRDPHQYNKACAYVRETMHEFWEDFGTDPYAATRRAIVRAAAAMAGE